MTIRPGTCAAAAVVLSSLLFLTCTSNDTTVDNCPTCVPCTNTGSIRIVKPDSNTIWQAAHICDTVKWTGAAGDSLQIRLYESGGFVNFYPSWVKNDSQFSMRTPLPTEWPATSSYQIQIIDKAGNVGWSKKFRLISDSLANIIVTSPDSSAVWHRGAIALRLAWSVGVSGGDSIKAGLYRYGRFIGDIMDWVPNLGTYVFSKYVQYGWGSGAGYQIKMTDKKGNFGWSRAFHIASDPGEVMKVISPDSNTVWKHGQQNISFAWTMSTGRKFRIDVFKNESLVKMIADSIDDTGTYFYKGFVPSSWGTGSNFQVKIADHNGNFGWSGMFKIVGDTLDSIVVSEPNSGTEWHQRETGVHFRWSGARDSLKADLYRHDTLFAAKIFGWMRRDSQFVRDSMIPLSWDTGGEYRIKITDKKGRYGFSQPFKIIADSTPTITVLLPDSNTRWYLGQTGVQIKVRGNLSPRIKAELYRGNIQRYSLFDYKTTDSTGLVRKEDGLPAYWAASDNYLVKVTDSLGNFGYSCLFSIRKDSLDRIAVSRPDSSSTIYGGKTGLRVWWTGAPGDSVLLNILRKDTYIADFSAGWIADSGVFSRSDPMATAWGSGDSFCVKVIDNKGYYGVSAPFTIKCDSLDRIIVITPDTLTTYSQGQVNAPLSWQKATGDSISADIYRDNTRIGLFCRCALDSAAKANPQATASCTRPDSIPVLWGSGTGFKMKIMDSEGHYGWSRRFSISSAK